MMRLAWDLLFGSRLDRMTWNDINAAVDAGTLTFAETKRVANLIDTHPGIDR